MSLELTTRQREIYDYIRASFIERQCMPSFREIANRFAISSTNGVTCHLKALVKKGLIEHTSNDARSIRLTGVRVVLVPITEGAAA